MVWRGLLGGPGAVALGFGFREEAGSSWGSGRLGWADSVSRMLDSSPSLVEFVFYQCLLGHLKSVSLNHLNFWFRELPPHGSIT